MPETIYYEDTSARISSEWFVFRKGAYRVEDVQSVTLRKVSSAHTFWYLLSMLVILSAFILGMVVSPGGTTSLTVVLILLFLLVIFAVFIDLVEGFRVNRIPVYLVMIQGSFGKSTALATLEEAYTLNLVATMQSALKDKRHSEVLPLPLPGPSLLAGNLPTMEHPYFSDGIASLSPKDLELGGNVYPLSAIKSAKLKSVQIDPLDNRLDLLASINWTAFGLLSLLNLGPRHYSDSTYDLLTNLNLACLFIMLGITLVKVRRQSLKASIIELSSASGRINAFVTIDGPYARALVAAVNMATKRYKDSNYVSSIS